MIPHWPDLTPAPVKHARKSFVSRCHGWTKMILDSIEDDLDEVDFGDTRLDNRLKRCVSQTAWMGESTLDRSRSSAEMKATYQNPSQHNQSTRERCAEKQRAFLAQNTTEFGLTSLTRGTWLNDYLTRDEPL